METVNRAPIFTRFLKPAFSVALLFQSPNVCVQVAPAVTNPAFGQVQTNPLPKRVVAFDWFQNAAPLPLTVGAPFKVTQWRNPDLTPPIPQDWFEGSVPLPATVGAPFTQTDWPLAQQPRRGYGLNVGVPLALREVPVPAPFTQTYWPNPQQIRYANLGFVEGSVPLPATVGAPARQTNWPNPPPARIGKGENVGMPLAVREAPIPPPFTTTYWPLPLVAEQPNVGFTENAIPLPITVGAPFTVSAWPLPQAIRRAALDSFWSAYAAQNEIVVVAAPFAAQDWPIPRGAPRALPPSWFGSSALVLIPPAPFTQTYWPLPPQPARRANVGTTSSVANLPASVGRPFRQTYWPNPLPLRYANLGRTVGVTWQLQTLVGVPVTNIVDVVMRFQVAKPTDIAFNAELERAILFALNKYRDVEF